MPLQPKQMKAHQNGLYSIDPYNGGVVSNVSIFYLILTIFTYLALYDMSTLIASCCYDDMLIDTAWASSSRGTCTLMFHDC